MDVYVILLESDISNYLEDRLLRKNYFTDLNTARSFIETNWKDGKWGFANEYIYKNNGITYTFTIEKLFEKNDTKF